MNPLLLLVEGVKASKDEPLVTCLLEGPTRSGKTAIAETIGIDSDFPYVKIVFEDAYKSELSIIILDDIERERICLLLELQVRWDFSSLLEFVASFLVLIMSRHWPRQMPKRF